MCFEAGRGYFVQTTLVDHHAVQDQFDIRHVVEMQWHMELGFKEQLKHLEISVLPPFGRREGHSVPEMFPLSLPPRCTQTLEVLGHGGDHDRRVLHRPAMVTMTLHS